MSEKTCDTQDKRPPSPFVLVEGGRHGLVVAAANHSAQKRGLYPNLAFTDACARVPDLISEEIDRNADSRALRMLAEWMVRFSPRVALDGNDAIILETTGCDHLFGGEEDMAQELSARLAANGHEARLAIASTPGAAWATARFSTHEEASIILDAGEEKTGLSGLPVAALRLSRETVQLLRRFGLTRIGQLYGLDRKALARRFASREAADKVVLRLDQALGLRHEPIRPLTPPADWCVRLPCPEPILSHEGVDHALKTLAADLCVLLETQGLGARDFCLHAFRADGGASRVAVSAARPTRDAAHMRRLLSERLEKIDPGFGIDLFLLTAGRTEAMGRDPAPLSAEMAGDAVDLETLSRLADRLSARLGESAVGVVLPVASHIPERAELRRAFEGELHTPLSCPPAGPRPLRLFECPEHIDVVAEVPDGPPVRFIWRRIARNIMRSDGPERIAPEWWKFSEKGARARDYYRVEDDRGRRYWLFRDGLYDDGRGGPPQWYMHGLFA